MSARESSMSPGVAGMLRGLLDRSLDRLTDDDLRILQGAREEAALMAGNVASVTQELALQIADEVPSDGRSGRASSLFADADSLSDLFFLLSGQAAQVQVMLWMSVQAGDEAARRADSALKNHAAARPEKKAVKA